MLNRNSCAVMCIIVTESCHYAADTQSFLLSVQKYVQKKMFLKNFNRKLELRFSDMPKLFFQDHEHIKKKTV